MKRNTRYLNRWHNIYKVCIAMELDRGVTATELSKVINLSRQSILKILKDAKTQGYVTVEKVPYRQHYKSTWFVTKYFKDNQTHHEHFVQSYETIKQLELGL